MVRNNLKWIVLTLLILFVGSAILPMMCKNDPSVSSTVATEKPLPDLDIPKFNPDSAYFWTEKIVAFGPRVTSTPTAARVKTFLVDQFKKFGADVIQQNFKDKRYDGKPLDCTNIIARYNPKATRRIVLAAHWDSRHIADHDPDTTKRNSPILGADDSGSALGMLIEIGRQLQQHPLSNVGVDIVLFDAEDLGDPKESKTEAEQAVNEKTWCLGSQYWSRNPHVAGYKAEYGILLDMAGARGARFTKEMLSQKFAFPVVEKVWRVARQKLGYVNFFVEESSGQPMTDDHVPVNEIAKIPMINIINHPTTSFFGEYWHTQHDDMSNIDKETLKAVGQTLLSVLHYEQANAL